MPAPERSDLNDRAVLWTITGMIDGEPVLSTPVELGPPSRGYGTGIRWNHSRTEMKDPKGQRVSLDASAVVTQKIAIDSLIWFGTLAQWTALGMVADPEVMQVVSYKEVPDMKGREVARTIGMMRYRGNPPPT